MSTPTTALLRENPHSSGLFFEKGIISAIDYNQVHQRLSVDGIIRIHLKDFSMIPTHGKFTHFNLEKSDHQPGLLYALMCIVRPGYYTTDGKEVLPVLDLDSVTRAQCCTVREHVPYADVTATDFEHSLPSIRTTNELKREILWRYHQSLPDISTDELLQRGVGITTLNIL